MLRLDIRFSLLFGPKRVPHPLSLDPVLGWFALILGKLAVHAKIGISAAWLNPGELAQPPEGGQCLGRGWRPPGKCPLFLSGRSHRARSHLAPWVCVSDLGRPHRAHLAPSHALLTASFRLRPLLGPWNPGYRCRHAALRKCFVREMAEGVGGERK